MPPTHAPTTALPLAGARPWRVALWLAVGYAAGAVLAWQVLEADGRAVFFAPAGVSMAVLCATPRAWWPLLLGTIAAVETAVNLGYGQALLPALGFTLANTLEPWLGAEALRRAVGFPRLDRRRDAAWFVVDGVLLAPLAGALVGGSVIVAAYGGAWLQAFVTFWAGDALGVLTIGGCALAWLGWDARGRPRTAAAALGAGGAASVAAVLGFQTDAPFVLPTVALFLAALLGVPAVTTGAASLAVTVNVLSATERGAFGYLGSGADPGWAALQAFLGLVQLGPWALAVAKQERDLARTALAHEVRGRREAESHELLTARLAEAMTVEEVLTAAAAAGAELADAVAVGSLSEDGAHLLARSATGRDGVAAAQLRLPLGVAHPVTSALTAPGPVHVHDHAELVRTFAPGEVGEPFEHSTSLAALACRADGLVVGVVALGFASPQAMTPRCLASLEQLATSVGPALHRAQAHDRDRRAAHQLQQALLPRIELGLECPVRVAVRYVPAHARHEVGGDWYDAFVLPYGRVALVVGDVVGHELAAAMSMGRLQPVLRMLAHEAPDPAEVLHRLDLASAHIPGAFMSTVGLADFQPRTGQLRYACAGHPPPLLARPGEPAAYLHGGRGLPLGVDPESARRCGVLTVAEGSSLVWYTDGVVETRADPIQEGMELLRSLVDRAEPGEDPVCSVDRVFQHVTERAQLLDDAVVLWARLGRGAPARTG